MKVAQGGSLIITHHPTLIKARFVYRLKTKHYEYYTGPIPPELRKKKSIWDYWAQPHQLSLKTKKAGIFWQKEELVSAEEFQRRISK